MKSLSPVEILKDLVAFPSTSKRTNVDIALYLEHHLARLGFDIIKIASVDEPERRNLLCKIGPDVEGGLMLSGHMDVVPVVGQAWDSDPFVLTEKDGKLFGRGTADMKGFIAATCSALTDYPLDRLNKPLILLFTYDEEVGCVGSAQAAPLLSRHMRYLPKACIIGEPTDFHILRMHTGHVTVRIHIKGKGVHSSDPRLGISAIKGLYHALEGLFAL
ncbi:MAG TPA: M20/M25/M40 family metallo-hydrolase, partial [Myxococcota bacterium]|nr:M20/M25/M40 family metallo-hydrolase [Myxococcota bacterium]